MPGRGPVQVLGRLCMATFGRAVSRHRATTRHGAVRPHVAEQRGHRHHSCWRSQSANVGSDKGGTGLNGRKALMSHCREMKARGTRGLVDPREEKEATPALRGRRGGSHLAIRATVGASMLASAKTANTLALAEAENLPKVTKTCEMVILLGVNLK